VLTEPEVVVPQPARPETLLIVQADDFGMCAAVTDGILTAHRAGVVTQASVMVPAPDAGRAMRLANAAGLPLGIHLVLACEWDTLRYYPLTQAASLRAADGAFLPGVAELRAQADPAEALTELRAQVAAARSAGVRLTHMESHVGVFDDRVLARLSVDAGLRCRDPLPPPGFELPLASLWHLSVRPPETKSADLIAHVRGLSAGLHMIVAHPASDDPELDRLCSPSSRRWKWARPIRAGDMTALLDPRFVQACAGAGVTLVDVPTGLRAIGLMD
jgi:hypothetical protein